MTTEPETIEADDETLDLDTPLEDDYEPEGDAAEPVDDDGDPDPAPVNDSAAMRQMRAQLRKLDRENRELRQATKATEIVDPGPEPKLEDFDYSDEKYAAAVKEWTRKVVLAEQAQATAKEPSVSASTWDEALPAFREAYARLLASKPEAEAVLNDVDTALSVAQIGAVVQAFGKDAADVFLRIGADAETLDRFAEIQDPLRLVREAAKLELPMKRERPEIDRPVVGKSPQAQGGNRTLAKLQERARETGDYTELHAYQRKLRVKA